MKKEAVFVVLLSFCFFMGYMLGSWVTLKAVANIASHFIDIDYTTIYEALYHYRENIGACWGNNEIFQNITN